MVEWLWKHPEEPNWVCDKKQISSIISNLSNLCRNFYWKKQKPGQTIWYIRSSCLCVSVSLSPFLYYCLAFIGGNCSTGQLARNPQKSARIFLPRAQIKGVSHIQTHILGLLKDIKTVFENTENEDWVQAANDNPKYCYWRASGSFNFF